MTNYNKIAIVSASLGVGGAERFGSLLSFILSNLGYEVHTIIINDTVAYPVKGKLVNLGKMFPAKSTFRPLIKGQFIRNYLLENEINTVVDNRSRPTFLREIFTQLVYGNRKKYVLVHSSNLSMYVSSFKLGAQFLYKNNAKIICVSKAIEQNLKNQYGFTNTQTIYNPVLFPDKIATKPVELPEKYFLFFGRFDDNVKNISLLIEAYHKSKVFENEFKLLLIGDGLDKNTIIDKIKRLELEKEITILPFTNDILPYLQHAFCTLLTSHFEGFPMAIVESLAAGIPVISVDCPTGPNEIIQNKSNGLLVPNYDAEAFSKAMKQMVDDNNLYQNCKMNASKSVEHLSLDKIALRWKKLLVE